MKLLAEIFHHDGIKVYGKAITRDAVRGIINDHGKLLMIYSQVNGDYKFPGGGVIRGESHAAALVREVREESGAEIEAIETGFGKVVEYDLPLEKELDVFKMTSHYYICKIGAAFGVQQLDQYEADLGFRPYWIGVDEALRRNKGLLRDSPNNLPRWIKREIFVLEQLRIQIEGIS